LLHEGRLLGNGSPRAVMTEERLSRLYGVSIRLVETDDLLFVVPS
jgi:ABC-type hemin transport system ATPase subunit